MFLEALEGPARHPGAGFAWPVLECTHERPSHASERGGARALHFTEPRSLARAFSVGGGVRPSLCEADADDFLDAAGPKYLRSGG